MLKILLEDEIHTQLGSKISPEQNYNLSIEMISPFEFRFWVKFLKNIFLPTEALNFQKLIRKNNQIIVNL